MHLYLLDPVDGFWICLTLILIMLGAPFVTLIVSDPNTAAIALLPWSIA